MKKIFTLKIISKRFIYPTLIFIFGLYAMKALFHPGFFTSLDGWHNIARLYHYNNAITDGQLPPRWISQLASGFGYPLFIFSYPMPWMIIEPFVLSGMGIILAVKSILLIAFIGSGLMMYLFIRDAMSEEAGLVAGIIYMWTPYRFAKIFVGASVGEATAFLFLPLFFWGIYKITKKEGVLGIVLGSLGFAGIALSHFMILPISVIFLISVSILFFRQAKDKKTFIKRYCFVLILGILLGAFYLFPLIFYSNDIKAKTMQGGFSSLYQDHFVTLRQLIYSKWGYGPIIHSAKDGEISFQVGIAQWLGVFIVFLMGIGSHFRKHAKNNPLVIASLFAFITSIFLMTSSSKFLWDFLHPFIFVDYPWRFLSMTTFVGAILCGSVVSYFARGKYILIFMFILVAIYTNRHHLNVNLYTDIPLQLYVDSETTTNTFAEYLPRWSEIDIGKKPSQFIEMTQEMIIKNLRQKTNSIEGLVQEVKMGELTFNQLYFPGMNVDIDGKRQTIQYKSDGRLITSVSSGDHVFHLSFIPTDLMRVGDLLTLFGIGIWVSLFSIFIKRRR